MKISIIGPVYPYRGGIAHYTTSLINAMEQGGHIVQTLSFYRQYPKWLYPGKSDRDPSLIYKAVNAEYILDPINPFSWNRTISKIIDFAPDLIVFQWWTPFWALAYSFITSKLKDRGLRTLYLVHNVFPHEKHILDSCLIRLAFRSVNLFITQTDQESRFLKTIKPKSRFIIHPHPIYLPYEIPTITKHEARRQLNIPLEKPTILFFGIIRPYKGLDVLLESLGALRRYCDPPFLIVAGEVWGKKEYLKKISELELEASVLFDNRYIPDEIVPLYFSAADLFVAPYLEATQSGAIKLAMGYDLPIIMSEAVATDPDMHDHNGLRIIPTADSHALEIAIFQWLKGEWCPQPKEAIGNSWDSLVKSIIQIACQP